MSREDELIAWLRTLQSGAGPDLPGDDAAILGKGAAARAVTVDQQIGGVHVPVDLDAAVWARRLLAVNLSDLAAMGARPEAALLTLAVPTAFETRRFLTALVESCHRADITLAGGDTARSPHAVTTLTAIGTLSPPGRWLRRSTARAGDRLWLGGPIGESAIGQRLVARGGRLRSNRPTLTGAPLLSAALDRAARRALRRHLEPTPQIELGRWLAARPRAAAIDVSDGFACDLHRLCSASAVGAVVDGSALSLPDALQGVAGALGEDPWALALGGGEDYCLLFALPPGIEVPSKLGAYPVGRITAAREVEVREGAERRPLEPLGWDHLTD